MGNECCSARDDYRGPLTRIEREHLKELYKDLTGPKRTKGKTRFNKTTLNQLFEENPNMALPMYTFMTYISKEDEVPYDSFEQAVEWLTYDAKESQLQEFERLQKIDILALATIGKFRSLEELKLVKVGYLAALNFFNGILKIFQYKGETSQKDQDFAAKIVTDSVFGNEQGSIDWFSSLQHLKSNFPAIEVSLKDYFRAKFLGRIVTLRVPNLAKTSSVLLNKNLASLLYLSNPLLQSVSNLEFLYSSRSFTPVFQQIADALDEYKGPTYILFKVEPTFERGGTSEDFSPFIIGGFNRRHWKKNEDTPGDSENYIFSLSPKFRNFFATKQESGDRKSFTHLKSGGYKEGLGFGGFDENDFRIWINGKDISHSYVRNEDPVYSSGDLVGPGINRIRVLEVEIWGLGTNLPVKDEEETTASANKLTTAAPYVESSTMYSSMIGGEYLTKPAAHEVVVERTIVREGEITTQSYYTSHQGNTDYVPSTAYEDYKRNYVFTDTVPEHRSTYTTTTYNYQSDLGNVGDIQGRSSYTYVSPTKLE